ncbi:class I SAM-dependent methyltransferase [Corynebacterium variabile]|uniref:class I SAM-dependent methyltransferase n=1 Tax=Corynebacterium variabile TaxID=1727 RepID=UPI0026475967|nr:class I SAM-dependent methyltransferase [Corynebacterium variabile]
MSTGSTVALDGRQSCAIIPTSSSEAPAAGLELGTSNGYSTIWLADALVDGAPFTTVDNDPGRAGEATGKIAAGLQVIAKQG